MPLVSFRPHTLRIVSDSGGYYSQNGDWNPEEPDLSEPIPCRYEPNGRANTIQIGEGESYVYSYMVYLYRDCPEIVFGQRINLYKADGELLGQFQCKGFHRGQLNSKVWV